jgi:hypothetical protein
MKIKLVRQAEAMERNKARARRTVQGQLARLNGYTAKRERARLGKPRVNLREAMLTHPDYK